MGPKMGPWARPMGQGRWARAHGPGPMGQGPWAKAHPGPMGQGPWAGPMGQDPWAGPMGRAQSLRFRGPGRARAQPAKKNQKNRFFGEKSEFGTVFSSVKIFVFFK